MTMFRVEESANFAADEWKCNVANQPRAGYLELVA